jgi:MFS family permease
MLQVLSAPVVARYIDAFNLEPLVLGLAVEAVSTLTFAFTDNYAWWCCARAISGIASSCIISSGFLHIQRRCGCFAASRRSPLSSNSSVAAGTGTTTRAWGWPCPS